MKNFKKITSSESLSQENSIEYDKVLNRVCEEILDAIRLDSIYAFILDVNHFLLDFVLFFGHSVNGWSDT